PKALSKEDCQKKKLLEAQQAVADKLSAEEIKQKIEEQEGILAGMDTAEQRSQKAQKLNDLVDQAEKIGKVKIESCLDLDIKEDSEEARVLLAKILTYCEASPKGFFAEFTETGDIKFTFATGTNNGTKSLT